MIKVMKGENVSMEINVAGTITLEIDGTVSVLDADSFEELRNMADHFWSANNLYNQTSEAKADRERHETEWGRLPTLTGIQKDPKN